MSANLCLFGAFFNFGKCQTSQGLSQMKRCRVHFCNRLLSQELVNSCNGSLLFLIASASFTVTFIRRLLTSLISLMRSIEIQSTGRLDLSS
jgi:hypothetical protein